MNFWVSVVITIFVALACYQLEGRYPKTNINHRHIFRAMIAWLAAWVCWIRLWWVASAQGPSPDGRNSLEVLLLSDLNTGLDILTCFAMTMGGRCRAIQLWLVGFVVVVSLGGLDIALLKFPGGPWGSTLHEQWSLVLSALSPLLIGWVFRIRYGVNLVFAVGIAYAILQPPAYRALLDKSVSDDFGVVVFSVLALLKVVLAGSVLWVVGRDPLGYQPARGRANWWPWLPGTLIFTGTAVLLGIIYGQHIQILEILTGQVILVVGAIVIVLDLLFRLLDRFALNQRGQRVATAGQDVSSGPFE
jgi:hypothetical protein